MEQVLVESMVEEKVSPEVKFEVMVWFGVVWKQFVLVGLDLWTLKFEEKAFEAAREEILEQAFEKFKELVRALLKEEKVLENALEAQLWV